MVAEESDNEEEPEEAEQEEVPEDEEEASPEGYDSEICSPDGFIYRKRGKCKHNIAKYDLMKSTSNVMFFRSI